MNRGHFNEKAMFASTFFQTGKFSSSNKQTLADITN